MILESYKSIEIRRKSRDSCSTVSSAVIIHLMFSDPVRKVATRSFVAPERSMAETEDKESANKGQLRATDKNQYVLDGRHVKARNLRVSRHANTNSLVHRRSSSSCHDNSISRKRRRFGGSSSRRAAIQRPLNGLSLREPVNGGEINGATGQDALV